MLPKFQSAYRSHHSTETAVAKVLSDILLALDEGDLACLASLDLSAAFNTVDHEVLLQRLHITYGVNGVAHYWFRSYLTGRHQYVRIRASQSSTVLVRYGVPQKSVLGPILFLLYTANIAALVGSHGLHVHLYADDTQIHGSCSPLSTDQLQSSISACIDDVAGWMASNRLQLNASKTEIMWCSSVRRQSQQSTSQFRVCNDLVTPSTVVRDLGIYMDSNVSMCSQVARTVSNCFFHTETTEKYPSFANSLRLPVHCSCSGIIEAGLWECNIGWFPVVPATPVAVDDECSSTTTVQCESV